MLHLFDESCGPGFTYNPAMYLPTMVLEENVLATLRRYCTTCHQMMASFPKMVR